MNTLTSDQIFLGVGLTFVLAVGSQVLASLLRIPALIVLLPVGFVAGALTDDINPNLLLGPAFQPLVSLAVAVILYDAGLGLDLRELRGHSRRVVVRLIAIGVPITWALATLAAWPLLSLSYGAALMLGSILVVSGPTVVGPLLSFVRPIERLQRLLAAEGSLIDPVGGILGALVFSAVVAGSRAGGGNELLQFLGSTAIGLAGGVIGTALLWLPLRRLRLGEVLSTTAQLAAVVGVAAACDALRDDTGLIAAITMGLAVANSPGFDVPARRPFLETLIQLMLGLLFISISATVTPQSLEHVVLPTLGLVAVLVLLARPLVAAAATFRTDLSRGERSFVGWMAPRGIVAAATASTFSAGLVSAGVEGADKILPATFLVIVMTVMLYGLTAAPMARLLGVTRPTVTRPLLVGGEPWTVDLGQVLQAAGLSVLMWAAREDERERIQQSGLELVEGELLAAATGEGAELEGITVVLLLTDEDDFNALASVVLQGNLDGSVYRLAPPERNRGVVAPYLGGEVLFRDGLTGAVVAGRHRDGARIRSQPAGQGVPPGYDLLFLLRADGRMEPVTGANVPEPEEGATAVLLGPAPVTERVQSPAGAVPGS